MAGELDFLAIGAQRSGTTSLRSHLETHPSLQLSRSKEAPFFSHEETFRSGFDQYLRREFGRPDGARKRGSVTPSYMTGGVRHLPPGEDRSQQEWIVPTRIHGQLPEVRILVILRDPVERLRSHYRLNVWLGAERRPLVELVEPLLTEEGLEEARVEPTAVNGYVRRGEYGRILAPYFEIFGPEQIHVGFTSDLDDRGEEFMSAAFAHIGVDPDFTPTDLGQRHHRSGEAWIGGDLRLKSSWRLRLGGRRLPPSRPLWRRLIGERAVSPERLRELSELGDDAVDALRGHFERDRPVLEELIGRAVPWSPGSDRRPA